jgi:hypothetical protein
VNVGHLCGLPSEVGPSCDHRLANGWLAQKQFRGAFRRNAVALEKATNGAVAKKGLVEFASQAIAEGAYVTSRIDR